MPCLPSQDTLQVALTDINGLYSSVASVTKLQAACHFTTYLRVLLENTHTNNGVVYSFSCVCVSDLKLCTYTYIHGKGLEQCVHLTFAHTGIYNFHNWPNVETTIIAHNLPCLHTDNMHMKETFPCTNVGSNILPQYHHISANKLHSTQS